MVMLPNILGIITICGNFIRQAWPADRLPPVAERSDVEVRAVANALEPDAQMVKEASTVMGNRDSWES